MQNSQDIQEGEGRYVTSLLKLIVHNPMHAKVHKGDRTKTTSPLQEAVWEKGMADQPNRGFSQHIYEGVKKGRHLGFDYKEVYISM